MSRLIACTLLAAFSVASPALAQTLQVRVLRPEVRIAPAPNPLPRFGFESFNIGGYGERVTRVHHFGLAADMGLEPGDVILRMNGYPLTYHGAWSDALREAMWNGGRVRLSIRDVRTGQVVLRQVFVGGGPSGPITPKSHARAGHNHHDHDVHYSQRDGRNRGPERLRGNGGNFGPAVQHRSSSSN